MNEQTAVELLKIATELMTISASKFPEPATNKILENRSMTLFNKCVQEVHDQYQQLTKGIETGQ